MPFNFHWYDGEPPALPPVAVNVTLVPAHTAPDGLAAMLTVGADVGLTTIVIADEVAVAGLAHAKFEVITQVTTLPLANELDE